MSEHISQFSVEVWVPTTPTPVPPVTTPAVGTFRFDTGLGQSWYLVPALVDSGDELRSKVVKTLKVTGRVHNCSMTAYGYDINQQIITADLEAGTNASCRPQGVPDCAQVAQSPRKQINVKNSVLWTMRIEGDDTNQPDRDEVHELLCEVADQGARR